MLDINDYLLEYKRKIPNILFLWTAMIVFITTFVLMINYNFKIIDYYQIKGIVKEKGLNISLPIEKVDSIINNRYIYIGGEKYKYSVKEISDNIVENSNSFYQNIVLDVDLKDREFIENNIIESKFIISKKTILEYIYNLIKGEF